MMLKFLDAHDLFNYLMLLHKAQSRYLLVVEGESDYNLVTDFFTDSKLDVIVGGGKPKLVEASSMIATQTTAVLFLIDADFDRMTGGHQLWSDNVAATDYYDLYMDLHFAREVPLRKVARRYLKSSDCSVDSAILAAMSLSEVLGALRYVSVVNQIPLEMSKFPVHLVAPATLNEDVDIAGVVTMALRRSRLDLSLMTDVVLEVEKVLQQLDRRCLINSHDLLTALSQVCSAHGDGKQNYNFEELFELAVDADDFVNVAVTDRIGSWMAA